MSVVLVLVWYYNIFTSTIYIYSPGNCQVSSIIQKIRQDEGHLENFHFFLRYRPKWEAEWNLIKTFKFITNLTDLIVSDMGIQKRLNLLV